MFDYSALSHKLSISQMDTFLTLKDYLVKEYRENGNLSGESIKKVLGNIPVIPSTHDIDSRLEASDEKARYGEKAKAIEDAIAKLA